MLNPKTNRRELAYIVEVSEVCELPEYDRVHYVHVLGWWCVASKEVKKGDKVIYFEIDSLLPESDKRFLFMAPRKYRVRTQKMCKVVSQGLVLPIKDFPECSKLHIGDFVTDLLKVRLYEPDEDSSEIPRSKSNGWSKAMDRHKKFFALPPVKFLMRYAWFRSMCKKLFVKKKDKIKWPEWLPKTHSERVQNVPDLFKNPDVKWVVSEKVDGMSTTFILTEKNEYMVCSHNVVVFSSKVEGSDKTAQGSRYVKNNVWLEMSDKYGMHERLLRLKQSAKAKFVAVQAETYGDGIQHRSYGLKSCKHDMAVFHVWIDGIRVTMRDMVKFCSELELPHVHVFDWEYHIPATVEDMIQDVDKSKSAIDGGPIEGFVIYSNDGVMNFKCVSPSFLMKYH